MFLSDGTIKLSVDTGVLLIEPFNEALLQPCSYDLPLVDVDIPRPENFIPEYWVIHPGQFLLASTIRIALPEHIAGTVLGKSTWGRKGLTVHQTAGHVDPGWDGELTLELFNCSQTPIVMHKGTSIAQIAFTYLDIPAEHPYSGRYQGSRGVVQPRPSIIPGNIE